MNICTALDWIKLDFNDSAGEDDDPRVVQEAASFDDDLQGMWRRVCLYTHDHLITCTHMTNNYSNSFCGSPLFSRMEE